MARAYEWARGPRSAGDRPTVMLLMAFFFGLAHCITYTSIRTTQSGVMPGLPNLRSDGYSYIYLQTGNEGDQAMFTFPFSSVVRRSPLKYSHWQPKRSFAATLQKAPVANASLRLGRPPVSVQAARS